MSKENYFLIQGKQAASDEEYYFYFWCLAIQDLGYIKEIVFQPKSIHLIDKKEFRYTELKKTKTKLKINTLFRPHVYTPDYVIVWHESAEHIFFEILENENNNKPLKDIILFAQNRKGKIISVIDTKGATTFQRGNSTVITFPLNQKMVYDKYGIYVNKVVPFNSSKDKKGNLKKSFFSDTFTPDEYRYRKIKSGKGYYKVNCIPRTLTQFLNK